MQAAKDWCDGERVKKLESLNASKQDPRTKLTNQEERECEKSQR